jgi:hypothetical protein
VVKKRLVPFWVRRLLWHDRAERRARENQVVILTGELGLFHVLYDPPKKTKVHASEQHNFRFVWIVAHSQAFKVLAEIT